MENFTKYCTFETKWGYVLIAWNQHGICYLSLPGRKDKDRKNKIKDKFPGAKKGDPSEIRETIKLVKKYFAGEKVIFKEKLDWSWATPFQKKALKELLKIPYGNTISYGELAKKAGSPKAARAVGTANAGNMIPLIIPCHRVIRSDGAFGGFSGPGGVRQKKRMLEMEQCGKY
jgi:methylated-DNA-[protein]-cysteine S-methyltransferase